MAIIGEEKKSYDVYARGASLKPGTPLVTEEKKGPVAEERPPLPAEEKRPEEFERPWRAVMEGSTAQGFAAGGAAILTILGLAGLYPEILLPVAVIGIGLAFLFEGWGVAARFSDLLRETSRYPTDRLEFSGGVTAEFLGGVTGVVLGILALVGLAPMVLVPVAVIVYGCTLVLGSGVAHRLNNLQLRVSGESEWYRQIAREMVSAATGVQSFLGLGAIVLGILSLVGYIPMTLSLIAMLAIGVAATFSGTAVCSRAMSLLRR